MLILKGLVGSSFQFLLFASLLLIPAGTWSWPRAIQFLIAYGVLLLVSVVWLGTVAPSSLEARVERPANKTQPRADRIASAIIGVSFVGWLAFVPVDVFRLKLLPPPSLEVSVFGALLFFVGYGIILTALYQNAFAAPVVRDQSERGHTLVDTGLYGRVRHPFYTGIILFFAGLALWLESYAALIGVVVIFGSLANRIRVEEQTLRETLPGYTEYMARVRYRLVPGVW